MQNQKSIHFEIPNLFLFLRQTNIYLTHITNLIPIIVDVLSGSSSTIPHQLVGVGPVKINARPFTQCQCHAMAHCSEVDTQKKAAKAADQATDSCTSPLSARPTTPESGHENPRSSPLVEVVTSACGEEGKTVCLGAVSDTSDTPTRPPSESDVADAVGDAGVLEGAAQRKEDEGPIVTPPAKLDDMTGAHGQGHSHSSTSTAGPCSSGTGLGIEEGAGENHSPSSSGGKEGAAAVTSSSSTLPQKQESGEGNLSHGSSLLDSLLGQESPVLEEDSSGAAPSDAGDSHCASNAPVINLSDSGRDAREEKFVSVGSLATSNLTRAGEASLHAAKDDSASSAEDRVIKTTLPSMSASSLADETVPAKGEPGTRSPSNVHLAVGSYDKKRLSERLRQRLAKRNQLMSHARASVSPDRAPTRKTEAESAGAKVAPAASGHNRSRWETRLQAASRQRRHAKPHGPPGTDAAGAANAGVVSENGPSPEGGGGKAFPDTVTFSDGEEEAPALRVDTQRANHRGRFVYRKTVSEVGVSLSQSTRTYRSRLSKHHPSHHHGIGILQADGIVYDDALLLRLARQARYGRLRGELCSGVGASAGERRHNDVTIHVYDLLTKDAVVEMPYFNCNFPIGECFKVINDGCHNLGTGAYHVGVEVILQLLWRGCCDA